MKLGDGDNTKTNSQYTQVHQFSFLNPSIELAALTGMGDPSAPAVYPGRDPSASRNRRVPPQSTITPFNPMDDDPTDHAVSVKSTPSDSHYIVAPSIQVRPEFSSIVRSGDASQPLTCIVIIELPARRNTSYIPSPVVSEPFPLRNISAHTRQDTELSQPPSRAERQPPQYPSSDGWAPAYNTADTESSRYAPSQAAEEDSPWTAIVDDLRNRIIDWKGHALSGLGPLQMYDLLSVRRDALVREFSVYLFKEAIICVVEEKKRSLGRFLHSPAFNDSSTAISTSSSQSRGVLRLKGRIYVRHIKRITTGTTGDMSLTIEMEDERLDSFILVFKDRSSLESWRSQIQALVTSFQQQQAIHSPPAFGRGLDMDEFGGSEKAARMLSGSTASTTPSTADSLLHASSRSSATSQGSVNQRPVPNKLQTLSEEDAMLRYDTRPSGIVTPHVSSEPSNSLAPIPHPPLDLILIISLPPPNSPRSTADLKIRVIKTSLDFILASVGIKDRLSLVTFEVGTGGRVRKTPYLCPGRTHSRNRLQKFIDEIGRTDNNQGMEDEFLVRASKDEKTDVVTAVNHG